MSENPDTEVEPAEGSDFPAIPLTSRGEARDAIKAALKDWVDRGVERPVIAIYEDVTGDDIPDFYGLSAFGEVVVVSGADLEGCQPVNELGLYSLPEGMEGP